MPYKYYPPVYVTINGKEVEMKNSYGWYSAEYIQTMNIPRCNIDVERKPNWYSATQCKKIKMPVTENETPVAAAIRETKEEAGIIVNELDLIPYGLVKRKEKSNIQGVFVQDNYYYLVNNYKLSNEQKLDDYEKEEGYTLAFVEPLHAITINRTHSHGDTNQNMLERDAKVLELLIDEGYLK